MNGNYSIKEEQTALLVAWLCNTLQASVRKETKANRPAYACVYLSLHSNVSNQGYSQHFVGKQYHSI